MEFGSDLLLRSSYALVASLQTRVVMVQKVLLQRFRYHEAGHLRAIFR